jgi:hypothetical protein
MFDPKYALVSLRRGEQTTLSRIYRDRMFQPGDEFGTTRAGEERKCWRVVEGQYDMQYDMSLATCVEAVLTVVPCAA